MLDVARNAPYVRTIEEAIAKVSQNPSATALVRLSDDRAAKVNLTGKNWPLEGGDISTACVSILKSTGMTKLEEGKIR